MKKIFAFILSLMLILLCACESNPSTISGKDLCEKEGCLVTANYICDMTCSRCGKVYKQLESDDTLLKELDEIDYEKDVNSILILISKIYTFLSDVYTADDDKKAEIIEIVSAYFDDVIEEANNCIFDDEKYYYKAQILERIFCKHGAINEFYQTRSALTKAYNNLIADLYYSPISEYLLDKNEDHDAMFGRLKNKKYQEQEEGEGEGSDAEDELTKQISSIKDKMLNYDYVNGTYDEMFELMHDFITLGTTKIDGEEPSFYEYLLKTQNGSNVSIDNIKGFFNFFKTTGKAFYQKATQIINGNEYSAPIELFESYYMYNRNTNNINTIQLAVDYLKTVKNDKINMFDVVNKVHKDGYAFYGTGASTTSCFVFHPIYGQYIASFVPKNELPASTFLHEFGHYLDKHSNGATFSEFASYTQEMLFSAYFVNNCDVKSKKDRERMKKIIVYDYLKNASLYSLTEEILYSLSINYSDIDTMFEDGIDLNEYKTFFEKMFECYGFEFNSRSLCNSVLYHFAEYGGYEIAYAIQELYGINTFVDALNDYDSVVNNYLNFLNCNGTSSALSDMISNNFISPFDSTFFDKIGNCLNAFFA